LQENPQKPEKKSPGARSMRTDIVHGHRFTPKLVAMKK
jgi:hypothetical protein